MKNLIASYTAGVATVLVALFISGIVSERRTTESFGRWAENKHDVIKSTFETKDWLLVELENSDEGSRNLTSSEYGIRRIFMKPKDQGYILCIEEGDGEPKKMWIGDNDGKQVVVSMSQSSLSSAEIFGSDFLTTDKNMDGLIDKQSENPPSPGTTIKYFTANGEVRKNSAEPMIDEDSGKQFKLQWTGSDWKKEYTTE